MKERAPSGSTGAAFGGSVIDPAKRQEERIDSDTGRQDYPGREILKSSYAQFRSSGNTGGGAVSNGHRTNEAAVVFDPNDSDIVYGVTNFGALLKFELSTFNNYVHSWGQD